MSKVICARTHSRAWSVLAASAAVICFEPSQAEARQAGIEFNIAEGALDGALAAYAEATRRQLLYSSDLVANRTTKGLRGRHSADRALELLLAGTGLRVRRAGNAYVLVEARRPRAKQARREPPAPPRQRARPADTKPAPAEPEAVTETVTVTGSNIRGAGAGSSPLTIVSRDEIERAGQATVGAAIAALPQNFGGTSTEDTSLTSSDRSTYNEGLGSGPNLRGLGSDATLTLINGRRVAGAGGQAEFTDISMIPLAAVERIEVLADGASAIYGSDAVGGVINVILRKTFKGGETRLYSGVPTQGGASEVQFGQVLGTAWSGGHVLAAYEYSRRERLAAAQRDYTRSADLRPLGGSDWRSFLSNPGTILGFGPSGALVPLYAVPAGQDGSNLAPGDFLPGANLDNFREYADTLPRQERHSGYATIEQEVGEGVRLFAEGRYGRRDFAFDGLPSTAVLQVLPANPYFVSPAGTPFTLVGYSFGRELGPIRQKGRVEAWNAAAGVTVDVGDWQVEAHGSHSVERSRFRGSNYAHSYHLNEALGNRPDDPATPFSTASDGFFNPFGDGAVNSRAILDFIGQGWTATRLDSKVSSATIKGDGTLFELPGGRVRLAVGGTYRRDQFERDGENFTSDPAPRPFNRTDASRSVTAGFAELAIPIFGEANARLGLKRLTLSAAVRHERYSDFGDTTNPKLGVVWEPALGVTLRGSYGTSFRAPAIREQSDPLTVSYSPLIDTDGTTLSVMTLYGGNPDLKPETARSLTLGVRYSPPDAKRWRFELGYFQTQFTNRIERPAADNLTQALTNPIFAPYVTRVDPVGSAADRALLLDYLNHPGSLLPPATYPPEFFRAILDARLVNSTRLTVRGIDLAVNGGFAAGGGEVSLALNASHMIDYQRQITPLAPAVEQVGTLADPPSWRGRASASFDKANWGATAALNYTHSYLEDVGTPPRRIDAFATIDLQLRFEPRALAERGFRISFNAHNLLDTQPPFVDQLTGVGYGAANADPLGRVLSIQVVKRW